MPHNRSMLNSVNPSTPNPLTCMSHYSGFCIITCKHSHVDLDLCISGKSFLQLQWLSFNTMVSQAPESLVTRSYTK